MDFYNSNFYWFLNSNFIEFLKFKFYRILKILICMFFQKSNFNACQKFPFLSQTKSHTQQQCKIRSPFSDVLTVNPASRLITLRKISSNPQKMMRKSWTNFHYRLKIVKLYKEFMASLKLMPCILQQIMK